MRWYISRKLSGADALPSLCNGGWKGHRIPPLASLIPVKVHFTSLYLLGCSDFGYGFHGIAWNSVFFFHCTLRSREAVPVLEYELLFHSSESSAVLLDTSRRCRKWPCDPDLPTSWALSCLNIPQQSQGWSVDHHFFITIFRFKGSYPLIVRETDLKDQQIIGNLRHLSLRSRSCLVWIIFPGTSTLTHYSDIVSDIPSWSIYGIYTYIYVYILTFYCFWHILWHSIWHSFWHTISHLFWPTFWHISGFLSGILSAIYSWHSFWHTFRHSVWHSFNILSGSLSDNLSDILSGISLRHEFGSRRTPLHPELKLRRGRRWRKRRRSCTFVKI